MTMTKTLIALTCAVLTMAGPAYAERAAGIEFDFGARPAQLRSDYVADKALGTDASLRFLTIRAIDGFHVAAALWQPNAKRTADTTLIVTVHGSGGSFDTDPNGFLSRLLAAKGYAVLGINTRQTGARVNTDNFMDVRRDIEAAVYTGRALGYRAIVLHGHSLGNIQVQYFAANNWDGDIKAIVLTGMFASLPWKSRNLIVQNEQNWTQLHDASLRALNDRLHRLELDVQMAWITGQQIPITAQHFLSYRAEQSSAADGTYWIRRVPYPVLLVRDAGDAIVHAFEMNALIAAATAPGSLVQGLGFVTLPNPRGPNPNGHTFTDNPQPLADTITAWLANLKL